MPASQPHLYPEPENGRSWQKDFTASIVAFLVALPLCLGIAIASGVPVSAGLITGIIGGIVVGTLAGCPLQVSGPAAGLTVIVYEAVQRHGLEMLGVIVLLGGLIQICAGMLRLGQWFRAVSPAVITGMLAGIGILIFASQFHVMLDEKPEGSGVKNLAAIPQTIRKAIRTPEFSNRDVRHDRRVILQEIGELHRRQATLNERFDEQLPHHRRQNYAGIKVSLSGLVEEQQAIIDRLQEVLDSGQQIYSEQPARQQQVAEAGQNVIAGLQQHAANLESGRLDLVIESQEQVADSLTDLQGAYKNHELAGILGILALIVLVSWKSLAKGRLSIVPAPLIAVIVGTCVAAMLQLPVAYVEIPTSISDEIHSVHPAMLQGAPWGELITTAVLLAVIASAETLLCASAVDQMQTGPRTRYDKELAAQGVGNVLCGLVGALPMTGVVVRSSASIDAGAKTRLAAILHGVWLLLFVLFLGTFLRMIPTSALAAILVYTGYKLVNLKAVKSLAQFGWSEVAIYLVTVTLIVVEDLLVGVLAGLVLSVVKLVLRFTKLQVQVDQVGENQVVLRLEGVGSFLKIPKLAQALESVPAGTTVKLDSHQLSYLDHAVYDQLMNWGIQHQSTGGSLSADWDSLKQFVREGSPPPTQSEPLQHIA